MLGFDGRVPKCCQGKGNWPVITQGVPWQRYGNPEKKLCQLEWDNLQKGIKKAHL